MGNAEDAEHPRQVSGLHLHGIAFSQEGKVCGRDHDGFLRLPPLLQRLLRFGLCLADVLVIIPADDLLQNAEVQIAVYDGFHARPPVIVCLAENFHPRHEVVHAQLVAGAYRGGVIKQVHVCVCAVVRYDQLAVLVNCDILCSRLLPDFLQQFDDHVAHGLAVEHLFFVGYLLAPLVVHRHAPFPADCVEDGGSGHSCGKIIKILALLQPDHRVVDDDAVVLLCGTVVLPFPDCPLEQFLHPCAPVGVNADDAVDFQQGTDERAVFGGMRGNGDCGFLRQLPLLFLPCKRLDGVVEFVDVPSFGYQFHKILHLCDIHVHFLRPPFSLESSAPVRGKWCISAYCVAGFLGL